jgi:GT2 family glycosyltransferase
MTSKPLETFNRTDAVRDGTPAFTISALIVTWNSADALPGLFETLQTGPAVEVVHVDNASTDASIDVGRTWRGTITQIRNARNAGFAAALKQAAAVATGRYLLIANPDLRLEPGAVATLASRLDDDPAVGAAGPKLLESDGTVQLFCARRLPNLAGAAAAAFGVRRLIAGRLLDPYTFGRQSYDEERDVPCLSGAAMLVRREALEAVGGIDDRWFMYFEDIDLCARLGQAGWRLRYVPAAVGRHAGAASSPRDDRLRVWLAVHLEAALNLFFSIHRGRAAASVHRALVGVRGVLVLAASPVTGAESARLGAALLAWAVARRTPGGAPTDAGVPATS